MNESARLLQLKAYLSESPDDPFLYYCIGLEYTKIGQDAEAEQHFAILAEKFPNYLPNYYHYGKLLEKAGKTEQAIEIYRIGVELALKTRDMHARSELQAALNLAMGLDEDE